jgi:transposase
MTKPAALSDEQLAYCKERLKNHWPWTMHTHGLIASLVAMAEERNQLVKDQAAAKAVTQSVYGC